MGGTLVVSSNSFVRILIIVFCVWMFLFFFNPAPSTPSLFCHQRAGRRMSESQLADWDAHPSVRGSFHVLGR